jgi:hypothetical protein
MYKLRRQLIICELRGDEGTITMPLLALNQIGRDKA